MPHPARRLRTLLAAILLAGPSLAEEPAAPAAVAEPADVEPATAEPVAPVDFPRAEVVFPELEQILADALAQAPRMMQQNLALIAADYDRAADRALLYPRIGGYAQLNVAREDRVSESTSGVSNPGARTVNKTYYDVSLTQPVFHWGSIKAQADIARIRHQIAERNYREAFQGLANEIRDAYLRLIIARVGERNRLRELDHLRKQREVVREQVAEGRVTRSTIVTYDYAIDALELAHDRAGVATRRALTSFQRLTGRHDLRLEDIPDAIPAPVQVDPARSLPLRTEFVTRRGYEDSSRVFNAQRSIEIQKLSLKIARNTLRPKFDLVAGVSQDEVDRTGTVEKYQLATTYAGLRVGWSIFDSFRTRSVVRAALARLRSAEMSLEQTEYDAIDAIEQSEAELGFLTRSLKVAERNYTGAVGSRATAIEFFNEGRYSQADVDAAESALRSAENAVCETRRAYFRAVADFLALVRADPVVERLMSEGRFPR